MLVSLALRVFGNLFVEKTDTFSTVRESLKKSNMNYTVQEYVSMVMLITVIVFAVALPVTLIFASIFRTAVAFVFALLITFAATLISFALGYEYPTMQARGRGDRINKALPFAVFYMATTASSGAHPINIFRMLSVRGGAVGEEASRIYSNVKTMGMDVVTAIEKAAARSPSEEFAELLYGMVSILTTGGSMESFLRGKTKAAMAQYRRSLNDYAKTVSLYTEIYITLIIVGSLFFIILLAIISPLVGGNTLLLQTFLVFFFIPLVSAGFIMLMKSASPME